MEGLRVMCFEDGVWHTCTGFTGTEGTLDIWRKAGTTFAHLPKKTRQLLAPDGCVIAADLTLSFYLKTFRDKAPHERLLYFQNAHDWNPDIMAEEAVNFVPHPKTLTMAGEWEYFAAGSHHPLPYALAELIDNSLRATRRNVAARSIVVSLVCGWRGPGMVSVWDNGCGMTKTQLNEWAVMNLTMEDRGQQPAESEAGRGPQGAAGTKQLCSDLSYFGVGSKNAAFFMGRCIKVTSKSPDTVVVHEMCIHADELEQRYKTVPDDVYKENIKKRPPGHEANLIPQEKKFAVVQRWLEQERAPAAPHSPPAEAQLAAATAGETFTRVSVLDLKPDILEELSSGREGQDVCRQLAHLYHYYLHGPDGNLQTQPAAAKRQRAGAENAGPSNAASGAATASGAACLPTGDLIPDIVVEFHYNDQILWSRNLRDVDDDMESLFLASRRSEMAFTLSVPGKGLVEGVLWYFPYINDAETVPATENPFLLQAQHSVGATQVATQAALPSTRTQGSRDESSDNEDDDAPALENVPIFETFWQGRLIPGSCVASLPFIDAVRGRQSIADREATPDECFRRIRGALFFGPSWSVTRNKLKLRDNTDKLLSLAVPTERGIEKTFKAWLTSCHKDLDKTTQFELIQPASDQAEARKRFGDRLTVFGRMHDGTRTIKAGDVVLCNASFYSIARVLYVGVHQVVDRPGPGSCGFAIVSPLPEALWGSAAWQKLSLRRVLVAEGQAELDAALEKESAKVPQALHIARSPKLRDTSGLPRISFDAGRALGEMVVEVHNAAGKKVAKALTVQGKRQVLTVCREIFRLEEGAAWPPPAPAHPAAAAEPSGRPRKGGRKGRKAQAAEEEAAEQDAGGSGVAWGAQVLSEDVPAGKGNAFEFAAVKEPVKLAGRYGIVFTLKPCLDPANPVVKHLLLEVQAGPAVELQLCGPGVEEAAAGPVHLGEDISVVHVHMKDAAGNTNYEQAEAAEVKLELCQRSEGAAGDGEAQVADDLAIVGDVQQLPGGGIEIHGLRVLGRAPSAAGLACFRPLADTIDAALLSQVSGTAHRPHPQPLALDLVITANRLRQVLPLQLLPGVPTACRLLPGHSFYVADGQPSQPPEALQPGAMLPPARVRALDEWGNTCVPSESLSWAVVVDSPGLAAPAAASFECNAHGISTLTGLHGVRGAEKDETGMCAVTLAVTPVGAPRLGAAMRRAEEVAQAGGAAEEVRVLLAPSLLPAQLILELDDAGELPFERVTTEEGIVQTCFLVDNVPAGSSIRLAFKCLGEAGQHVAPGTAGRVFCGWMRKARRATLEDAESSILLPPLTVPTEEGTKTYDVQFKDAAAATFDVCVSVKITVVPGPPTTWNLVPGEDAGVDVDGDVWSVRCGKPFTVYVEALDAHGNRCSGCSHESFPDPEIAVLEDVPQSRNRLLMPGCEVSTGWQQDQPEDGGCPEPELFGCELLLAGEAGLLTLQVAASALDDGAMAGSSRTLNLINGDPAALRVAVQSPTQLGAAGTLGTVHITTVDAWGNAAAPPKPLEVLLDKTALATNGGAASAQVTAEGLNRCRLVDGQGAIKGVQLSGPEGEYRITVKATSRATTIQEGSATVTLRPTQSVTAVTILADHMSLTPLVAGAACMVPVLVDTENGERPDADAAAKCATLKMMAPGGRSKAAQVLRLDAAACAAVNPNFPQNCFVFSTPALQVTGSYTFTAEWQESRPGFAAQAVVRSPATSVSVAPGPAKHAEVVVANDTLTLTASNGRAEKERLILKQLRVQLVDQFHNPAPHMPCQARVMLRWVASADPVEALQPPWPDCELPGLQCAQEQLTVQMDCGGLAEFGNVLVQHGTGRVPPEPGADDDSAPAVRCHVCVDVRGLAMTADGGDPLPVDADGWAIAWHEEVLFTDNAAHFARIAAYSQAQRKQAHAAAAIEDVQARLQGEVDEARAAAGAAAAETRRCQDDAREFVACDGLCEAALCDVLLLRNRLEELQAEVAALGDSEGLGPRIGNVSKQKISAAVKAAMALQDPDVLGSLAHLGTVNNVKLSELLAAHFGSGLRTLVVRTRESRVRIQDRLGQAKHDIPDILSLPMVDRFASPDADALAAMKNAPAAARQLLMAATHGSDPPLACALPHAVALAYRLRSRQPIPEGAYTALDWPTGCLGYACNLVRPASGHTDMRATLFWTMLGRTLVFATLAAAEEYRAAVLRLGGKCGDFISLDGRKIRANGVVCGSSFQTMPLAQASYRFASLPSSQDPTRLVLESEAAALARLEAALEEEARCKGAEQAAVAALEAHSRDTAGKVQELQTAVVGYDELIKRGTKRTRAASGGVKPANTKRRQLRSRGAGNAQDALAAAGLEDDEDDTQPGPSRRRSQDGV